MKIKKESVVKSFASCNFCSRGELSAEHHHTTLNYPYEIVYTFSRNGNGIQVSICEDCLAELYNNVKELKNTTT